jgi:transcriptional regulator with PAS, ATPase and Fis domain
VAATNVNIQGAIEKGKFREDLYYRLNTVPVIVPSLRERKQDIYLLFRKFAADFSAKYRMPVLKLDHEAEQLLTNFYWPGNVRQLKNITEQISVIEKQRDINGDLLRTYLPVQQGYSVPMLMRGDSGTEFSERDLLYKVLFDMKKDLTDLKKVVMDILNSGGAINTELVNSHAQTIQKLYRDVESTGQEDTPLQFRQPVKSADILQMPPIEIEDSLSIEDKELELIKRALEKHKGRRKNAAKELGISERTLYRKINEHNIK